MPDVACLGMEIILLLAGILFILVAAVGGGIEGEKFKVPKIGAGNPTVSTGIRVLLFLAGCVFLYLSFTLDGGPKIVYEREYTDLTDRHGMALVKVRAEGRHNPPRKNDVLTIRFTLRNQGGKAFPGLHTFVAAYVGNKGDKSSYAVRRPESFGRGEKIEVAEEIGLDTEGMWEIWPCYYFAGDSKCKSEETCCTNAWESFPVGVGAAGD